ncbi:SDR family NAD(P)-dependent oxidoreductase [Streptomyces sp. NPDC059008]|uniref:SDR family NAD(P)-dependent oxidoreductase n=1 Tax=Streptomyces sp. NPDC059008 TaxID=3346693 RepID=UPI0036BE2E8B
MAASSFQLAKSPIAVIGIAGTFPQAHDVGEFWCNVVSGRDCITQVPESSWRIADHYDPDPLAEDKTYARRGGFLPPTVFDPAEFAMPPATLDSIGLVQLLSLRVAGEVLRDARCDGADWYDPSRAGVILGVCGQNTTYYPLGARLMVPYVKKAALSCGLSEQDAEEVARRSVAWAPSWTEDSFPGILANVVAGRIANRYGLGAANCTVDAACASSLAALRMAVSELVEHRADLMITGGCDADNSITTFLCFSKTPALSPSGRIRPFDESADGTLLGEGIGMLALKRLADAERDGDRIYAVLRGLGDSSDGRTSSIYAPCGDGQMTALRRAYEDAGVPPQSVELIEAHGTGTPVGDHVEIGTLRALMDTGDRRHRAAVGTVKSQIGHTKAAAGAAGLIKTALALHHKVLPPTINIDTPGEAVREGSLYLNTRARPWVRDPGHPLRRGAVSAFGFGGVNFHAVLEEHQPSDHHARTLHGTPQALLWHAPDPAALLSLLRAGAPPAEDGPVPAGHARLGVLARTAEEREAAVAQAVARLGDRPDDSVWSLDEQVHFRREGLPPEAKSAALFAGQGSQYVEMGLHTLLAFPPVRRTFDQANALWTEGDDTLARVVYPEPGRYGPQEAAARLRRTSCAQPAIGALAMGQFRYLTELGFTPHGLLGHSSGEITALWAAGSLSDADCLRLALQRGQAMERADDGGDPGAMVALRLSVDEWRERASGYPELALSNINAPDEVVLGGPTPAIEALAADCARDGTTLHRLPVAAAFHTPLVGHAVERFAGCLAGVDLSSPATPVLANTPGASYGGDPEANRRVLAEQIVRPVDFAARVRELYAEGCRGFVECGPKQVLSRLVPRILGAGVVEVIPTDHGPGSDGAAALKCAALRLAVLGFDIRGINRYDAPEPAPRREPSPVARLLEGSAFAVEAHRAEHEALLATPYQCEAAVAPTAAEATPAGRTGGARTGADVLGQLAARQLELHNEYLAGQLETSKGLAQMVSRSGTGPDASVLACAEAVRDHSAALGRAHIRSQEVLLELARSGLAFDDAATGPAPAGADGVPPCGEGETPVVVPPSVDPVGPPATGAVPAPRNAADTASAAAHEPAADRAPDGAPMDVADVERILCELVAEKTGYTVEMVDPDLDIQTDLGIDSLKQVEIASEAWQRYPFLPQEDIYRFAQARTVGELARLVHSFFEGADGSVADRAPVAAGRARVGLRTLPAVDAVVAPYGPQPTALLAHDGSALADALRDALTADGWGVRVLALPDVAVPGAEGQLADWREETLRTQIERVLPPDGRLGLCVLPADREPRTDPAATVRRLRHAVLLAKHTVPALKASVAAGHRAGFAAVTRLDGSLGLLGTAGHTTQALYGGLGGLVKALGVEEPDLFCRAFDSAPESPATGAAAQFLREIADSAPVREVGWDGETRRTLALSPEAADRLPADSGAATGDAPSPDDLLVVTGGARGITAWCLTALAARRPCRLVLLGRTPLEDPPAWAAGLDDPTALREACAEQARARGEDPGDPAVGTALDTQVARLLAQREVHTTLAELRGLGADATYVSADITDAASVGAALAPWAEQVTGVLHGAGVLADQPLAVKEARGIERVVDTKLSGLQHVLAALPAERLHHLIVFTSVSGIYGNGRQTDYAMANEALNRFACAWKAAHPGTRVAALAWGPWRGGMASERAQELFQQLGVPLLSREEGCRYFVDQLTAAHADDLVTVLGPLESAFPPGPLPADGVELLRDLTGLAAEPVLEDHSIDGQPVLPMTAALGWGVDAVERTGSGNPVTEVRDFSVRRGLVLNGSHPPRARVVLRPRPGAEQAVAVTIQDDGATAGPPRYEGVFGSAPDGIAPDPHRLPPLPEPPYRHHSAYGEGFLFHGPLLRGLGPVLVENDRQLVLCAKLADPPLAQGAYGGARYSPALADLLLQAAALLGRRVCGHRCLPVSVRRVELVAPLPDDAPFVIQVDLENHGPLELICTVTACAPDGAVLQRWSGLKGIVAAPQLGSRAAWPPAAPDSAAT